MKKIGFIGVGIMGKSMVRNLMKTGYELHIYARTKAKVDDVISEGAIFHESIKECVPGCDAVITIVGFPRDVEEVYFDEGGILENADPGTYLIDMTTTSPMLAEKISKEGTEKGFHVLDAPVTGGDTGAKNATLSILVGGEKEECVSLLRRAELSDRADKIPRMLSGGEKQRIAIARMLLKDAPIVILDEATAFTDPENEDKIQKSIAALTKNKTLLVIAHRLSTIKNADNIVVLEKGKIIAEGRQEELPEKCPLYKDMWLAHIGAKNWAVSAAEKEAEANV